MDVIQVLKVGRKQVFTYVLGHLVQYSFSSTHDYHVHSLLSQLREAIVQQWAVGKIKKITNCQQELADVHQIKSIHILICTMSWAGNKQYSICCPGLRINIS